jgi:hypothetical protein
MLCFLFHHISYAIQRHQSILTAHGAKLKYIIHYKMEASTSLDFIWECPVPLQQSSQSEARMKVLSLLCTRVVLAGCGLNLFPTLLKLIHVVVYVASSSYKKSIQRHTTWAVGSTLRIESTVLSASSCEMEAPLMLKAWQPESLDFMWLVLASLGPVLGLRLFA